jgi:hypothetical protein
MEDKLSPDSQTKLDHFGQNFPGETIATFLLLGQVERFDGHWPGGAKTNAKKWKSFFLKIGKGTRGAVFCFLKKGRDGSRRRFSQSLEALFWLIGYYRTG